MRDRRGHGVVMPRTDASSRVAGPPRSPRERPGDDAPSSVEHADPSEEPGRPPRGRLRVYLGAAPGVGKTYAMLNEGRRRASRGTDVVVAVVETHGRPRTAEQLAGLEVIPRRDIAYRDTMLSEMDLEAVLERRPEVALVDELAHSNVPGVTHEKRWEDVEDLLAAGIDVITTLNVQHLESLNDVVEQVTKVRQRETVPDAAVRQAEQIELVDMTPEALRRRMAHGNVYAAEKIDAALRNFFRIEQLSTLRELALIWLADQVDDAVRRYRAEHQVDTTWEARERVVVALTGGPEGPALIRRASRIASRASADLLGVHIVQGDGVSTSSPTQLAEYRQMLEQQGGTLHVVVGDSVPRALLEFARAENATQLVLGASRRSRIARALTGPGTSSNVVRNSGRIDVHLVSHDYIGKGRELPHFSGGLTVRRRLFGAALAVVFLPILALLLHLLRPAVQLPSDLLVLLLGVVGIALVGGLYPALFAAVEATLLANVAAAGPAMDPFSFAAQRGDLPALAVFVLVAVAVSTVVDMGARRAVEGARTSAEAAVLSALAESVLRAEDPLAALVRQAQQVFPVREVRVETRDGDHWRTVARAAEPDTTSGAASPVVSAGPPPSPPAVTASGLIDRTRSTTSSEALLEGHSPEQTPEHDPEQPTQPAAADAAAREPRTHRARQDAALPAPAISTATRVSSTSDARSSRLRTLAASEGVPTTRTPEPAASAGRRAGPPETQQVEAISDTARLVLVGHPLGPEDQRILNAFTAQAAVALRTQHLGRQASEARALAEGNRMRTALLAAVSHDLRTPLSSIKASVSSLRQTDVDWTEHDRAEFLATIEESADRLRGLVGNLLDMSRLTTGAVNPLVRLLSLEEFVPAALRRSLADLSRIRIDISPSLSPVLADPGLLERALANLVDNALNYSPPDRNVTVAASRLGYWIELRVVDHGRGLGEKSKERCFEPFQRLGDAPNGAGVGLGLPVARGFVEAMNGRLFPEDTPGGGLTMVISLPMAENDGAAVGAPEEARSIRSEGLTSRRDAVGAASPEQR